MFNLLASAMVKLGELAIPIIDIVAFVFLFIAIITGIKKGFAKQLLSLLGLVASIVVAVLLCGTVSKFIIENMPGLYSSIEGFVAKTIHLDTSAAQTEAALREALSGSSIPAFLHEALIKSIVESNFQVAILTKFTGWVISVISFLFLLIFSRIIFAIIKKVIFGFVSLPFIRTIDQVLGMVFSVIKCLLLISIILIVLSIFMGSGLNDLLKPDGTSSLINKLLELIMNLPFITKFLGGIVA
jgi:uncharacterized membrane protein required for colicin V production